MIKRIWKRVRQVGRQIASGGRSAEKETKPADEPRVGTAPPAPVALIATVTRPPAARREHPGESRPVAHPRGRTAPANPSARTPAAPPKAPDAAWNPEDFVVPVQAGMTRFQDLKLREELLHAVHDLGFQYCTPIQTQTLPAVLDGRDVAGRAQTGTGKTAAFLIGIFQHMLTKPITAGRQPGTPRALVLAPTRELVMQIQRDAKGLGRHCPFHTLAVYGGEDITRQRREIAENNPEIVAATPGRLIDLVGRGVLHLGQVEILVIDEADRMLDMGFIPDVRRIVHLTPGKERRQTLFFSATLSEIVLRLAGSWTRTPLRVDIDPEQVAVGTVNQIVYIVTAREKFSLLYNILRREPGRALLFANRRDTAARLSQELRRYDIHCALISGALPQNERTRTLEAFREGRIPVLVATDVASRGLHVEDIRHVINYNLPMDPEDYVHRIGRTGRAGASGTSISFACEDESMYIPDIEKFIGQPLVCTHPPDEWLRIPPDVKPLPRTESAPTRTTTAYRRPAARGQRPRSRR